MPLKEERLRDAKYLVWVRDLSCIACRQEGVQCDPDHINLPMQGTKAKKAPDDQVLPLCHRCHTTRHNMPVGKFYPENTGHTVEECVEMARTIYRMYKSGKSHDAVKWALVGWRK